MQVILFDIDGTLIHSGGAGLAALRLAFEEAFCIATPWEISLSGRTDRGIARELFAMHGLAQSDANWVAFRDAYLKHLRDLLPQRSGAVLPGVYSLIDELLRQEQVAIGLLTGNVRDGARAKLEYYQLNHHFRFGGYGDHAEERDHVAREALEATRVYCQGYPLREDRIWVIGDTPLDIRCARYIGARVAAVATGSFTAQELAPFAPDLLLEGLDEPELLAKLLRE